MKYIKIFILLVAIMCTTGCWNYRELNKISVVTAVGIDVSGDEYIVSVDIVNSKKVAGNTQSGGSASDETPTILYQIKAKTMKEAMNNIIFQAPKQLYTGHMSLLAIGEEAAKKGILNYIDYFMADTEIRKIFPVVVVENGKAIDALKIILPLETITSEHISSSLQADAKITSYLSNRKFDEVLNCLYIEGRHPTTSAVKIIGSPEEGEKTENTTTTTPKNSVEVSGSAIFLEDKLVGYIHGLESLGYTILRGLAKTMVIQFPCDEKNYASVVVDNVKSKIETSIKDKKPIYKINISGRADIPEYNCKVNLKNIEKIEKMVNEEMKKIIDNTMIKLQKELKSDVVGFGERLYKEHFKYWEKIKKDWNDIFPDIKYKTSFKIKIESIDSTIVTAKEAK